MSSSFNLASERAKDRQLAITLISMNLLFLLMNVVITVMNIVTTFNQTELAMFIYRLSIFLFKANFTLPFFIYFFSNSKFRSELKEIFRPLRIGSANAALQSLF